ncbi:DUF6538 domain-containing protein [Salipiger sp. PrR002]|uniref:DUF6538 domain-containing protein n=1 Tax=Salipiger sp. PrR002 TaxID=2706489 RepID=UPI0013BB3B1E|nr:DUF6538 domain-containing protein [Salipiger sp. PrR002]NDW02415.1 hypothetical protein [Salipiger sp. PrR002]NDW59563.1 hypothetical protein [Salipiger sp. PrR004]
MPKPVMVGSTYYLRINVPRDVLGRAAGTRVSVPVGDRICQPKITTHAKVSLRTKDWPTAKRRFSTVLAALEGHWEALRRGQEGLTHKQAVAIAGEVVRGFLDILEDEPGSPELWECVAELDEAARAGRNHPLAVPTAETRAADIESRFGGLADAALRKHGLLVDEVSRRKVLERVAVAMEDVTRLNAARAKGDYSETGTEKKYPAYAPKSRTGVQPVREGQGSTFGGVIDVEIKRRAAGRDAKPMSDSAARKYRRSSDEFATFRNSKRIETVTARQADDWKRALLDEGKLSNSTIAQRLQNLRTVVEWARRHALGELFPDRNPLDLVELPQRQGVRSEDRTYRMSEARTVLEAARHEVKPELRWLPWMCAYSGARIEELAQLMVDDFFECDGEWFYRLTNKGGKTLKNRHSIRVVPVHADLMDEGLLKFVYSANNAPAKRLFPNRSQGNVAGWIRRELKITRRELAPSHGWRHLFEDLALRAGMLDSAKTYITGRSGGKSAEGYGKSEAMLPGLYYEMQKIPSFL